MCRTRTSCSPVISSNTTPPAIAATVFGDWGSTLDNIKAYDVDAIAPGRGDALVGKDMVNAAIENTRDFVESTYRPAAKVAARGGSLKEAWDAVREACDLSSRLRDLRTLPAVQRRPPMTRPVASTPASGPPSAIWRCRRRCSPDFRL